MKYTKAQIAEAWKILEQYRGKNIAAAVNHVSRSGMSRRIELYAIHDSDISRIGYLIARVTGYGYDMSKGGIRADGCGMDMRFSILSNFNYAAYRHDLTAKGYDTEKAMHLPEACALMGKPQGYRIYDDYFFDANNIRSL